MSIVTIYQHIYDTKPHYLPVDAALKRIAEGKSKIKVEEVRAAIDKEKQQSLKTQLPATLWSGEYIQRLDSGLKKHSGFMVLDHDNLGDKLRERQTEIISYPFVYACWVSPGGNGLKTLVKIADGSKHRAHFDALREVMPDIDRSGVNESRVCYESYDPDIYINTSAEVFTKTKVVEQIPIKRAEHDKTEVFKKLLVWLANKGDAFQTGERNSFVFKLAAACCRFGIAEETAQNLIISEYSVGSSDFTQKEAGKAVKSAYRANQSKSGTAQFEKEVLVDRVTKSEVTIETKILDLEAKPKDVIFGADVKAAAVNIYRNGYDSVLPLGIPPLDNLFKCKKGEISLLTGIGNYGKSTFKKWFQLLRAVKWGEKFASFAPEDAPAEEFYHDLTEMLLGTDCSSQNYNRPPEEIYEQAYDFVSRHFFFIYPKELTPSPEYIKEKFLELIIKEKVSGIDIDPFNQLANDYSKSGGRTDKYLETFLSDYSRFSQANGVYGWLVAHPHKLKKDGALDYPCPDVFEIADGAMWNNKMDNIMVYHRPFGGSQPDLPVCELHTKKIRRQKSVGKKGVMTFEFIRSRRRFFIDGIDYMQSFIDAGSLSFAHTGPPSNYTVSVQGDNPF